MKMEFISRVKRMQSESLTRLVTKISEIKPDLVMEIPNDKVTLSLDEVDKKTYDIIMDFINTDLVHELPLKR